MGKDEDEIELNDYLKVIWERKILIIVGVLASIVLGVVISLKSPVTYRSDAIVNVGKKVELQGSLSVDDFSFSLVPLEKPSELTKSILIQYGKAPQGGFWFETILVPGTSMIKIISKGPDGRTEKYVKELVKKLIDDHRRIAKASSSGYELSIEALRVEIEEMQESIAVHGEKLKKEKNMEKQIIQALSVKETNTGGTKDVDIALMDVLYRKVVHIEKQIRKDRAHLSGIRRQLLMFELLLSELERSSTTLVDEVENTVIKPNVKRGTVIAGFAGLIMFLFLAFLIEFLGAKKVRKNNYVTKKEVQVGN
ncbi:MAG: hypothetical protein GY777_07535 [Candidatus Brocadiaceae bacterium]|nr:hypothetical protein [Candidatus Brocadiaceae bacterium]